MCEKCDVILEAIQKGSAATMEERVALTAVMGALMEQHGPETVLDLLANALGFVDYQIGRNYSEEKRDDMRALLQSLLEDYYGTANALVDEERGESADVDERLRSFKGSVH